jgi:hypothetical protein
MTPAVILGLVPRIHLSANAGASGGMDGRDKPDHDNLGKKGESQSVVLALVPYFAPR